MARPGILGKAVAQAARGPVNLSVIGLAVVGAAALGSWPILALGGAAYAALIAADLVNPAFRRRLLSGRAAAPTTLPRDEAIRDPATRAAASSVRAALAEVQGAIAATPERVRRHIQLSVDAIGELEGHAAGFVARAEALAAYLASVDVAVLRAEADGFAERARRTSDAQARAQYEQSHTAVAGQLRAVADIETSRERILASLLRISTTLRAIPAQLVRMRALDDQASDALSGNVTAELDHMNIELKAFEQTLEDLQEVDLS